MMLQSCSITKVCTGSLSSGGSSSVDISRMPDMAMFSVRGIGVAERVSTSTPLASSLMCSLCVTPKRCSSSTTSRPRSLNFTSLLSSLCVPITRSHFPVARSESTFDA